VWGDAAHQIASAFEFTYITIDEEQAGHLVNPVLAFAVKKHQYVRGLVVIPGIT